MSWSAYPDRPGHARGPRRTGLVHPATSGLVVASAVAAVVLIVVGAGPARAFAVVTATTLAPGLAAMPLAVGRWGRAGRVGWAVGVSVTALAGLAVTMAWTRLWYPSQVTVALLLGSAWATVARQLRPVRTLRPAVQGAPTRQRVTSGVVDALPPVAVLAAAGALGAFSGPDAASIHLLLAATAVLAVWAAVQVVAGGRGGTLGQRLVGLRLVDSVDGRAVGAARYAARAGSTLGLVCSAAIVLPSTAGWASARSRTTLVRRQDARNLVPAPWTRPTLAALLPGLVLVPAGVGWAVATATADVATLGPWGLTPALGVGWFVCLAVVVAAVALGPLVRWREAWLAAHLGLLTLMLYGTPGMVEDTPRLPWSYKHIAVTRAIEAHGSVDPHAADIYQRWPGMFSWAAVLAHTSGYPNPVQWEYLAEVGFALLNVVLVVALARALAPGSRWTWAAGTVFTIGNWVGQNYFSPQSLAYLLFLFVALVAVRTMSGEPNGLVRWAERLLLRRRRGTAAGWPDSGWPVAGSTRAPWWAATAILAAYAVIVVSHQLTPYVGLLALVPLVVLGYLRPWWVTAGTAALTLAFLGLNFSYVNRTYGLLSSLDPVENATYSSVNVEALSRAASLQRDGTLLLAAIVLGTALAGLVRRAVAGEPRQALVVGWLMLSPWLMMAGQSYGGEIRLRAYLFGLPWASIAASWLFGPLRGRRWRLTPLVWPAFVLVVVTLFTLTYFQPAATNRTSIAQQDAMEWIDSTAAPGTVVLTAGPSPASIGPNYLSFHYGSLSESKVWLPDQITPSGVAAIIWGANHQATRALLLYTDQDLNAADPYPLAPGELTTLVAQLKTQPGVTMVWHVDDTYILQIDVGQG